MASELLLSGAPTGTTVYGVISNTTGSIWNGSSFESYTAANWGTYAVTFSEQGSSSRFIATFPTGISTAGIYRIDNRLRAGGSPAVTDSVVGAGEIEWSGTTVLPRSSIQADTDDIQTRLPAALISGKMDSNTSFWNGTAVASPNTAGIPLVDNRTAIIRIGTAQTGTSTTITLDTGASSSDNYYKNDKVFIISGTGIGQVRTIRSYIGATKVATIARPWVTTPDATSVFSIVPATSVWDETLSDHQLSGSTGFNLQYIDNFDITLGAIQSATTDTNSKVSNLYSELHIGGGTYNLIEGIYVSTVAITGSINDTSPTTTSFKTDLTQVDNYWNDMLITFTSGSLTGQTKPILTFTNNNSLIIVDEAFTSAPVNGDAFQIKVFHTHSLSQLNTQTKAQVVAALSSDNYTEPTGAPAATNTIAQKLSYLYEVLRNKISVTDTTKTLYDDSNNAQWSKTLSDDGTIYIETKAS